MKEGQTQAESEGFIIAQLTDGIMEDSVSKEGQITVEAVISSLGVFIMS